MRATYKLLNNLYFDAHKRIVFLRKAPSSKNKEETLQLGDSESEILYLLAVSATPLSKEDLLNKVWRERKKVEVDYTSVTKSISLLRKSLNSLMPGQDFIITIPKLGYILSEPAVEQCSNKNQPNYVLVVFYIMFIVFIFSLSVLYKPVNNNLRFERFNDIHINDIDIIKRKGEIVSGRVLPIISVCLKRLPIQKHSTVLIHVNKDYFISLTNFTNEGPAKNYKIIYTDKEIGGDLLCEK